MNEALKRYDTLQVRENSSFVPYFEVLFAELQKAASQGQDELKEKAQVICDYLGDFWKTQAKKAPQQSGSFGRNTEGIEQPAHCMTIDGEVETTICKWGFEIGSTGERTPRITIFTIPYKSERNEHGLQESDHQYNVELAQENLTIDRRDWAPSPGQPPWKTTTISVSLNPEDQKQLSDSSNA